MTDPTTGQEPRWTDTGDVDLVVYGATAGGVVAATAAARLGMRVVLADPTEHVGGMVSGGLGRSDVERQEHLIGGLAREFFEQVGRRYPEPRGSPLAWRFEPKVAALVLREWVDEAGVLLAPGWQLKAVEKHDTCIRQLVSGRGDRLTARCFVDATYEGDLLAAAGVSYDVGRDGQERYGESLAGRRELLPNPHQFSVPVSAVAPDGQLLPRVQPYDEIGPLGHGDGKVQSYCYRLCLTEDSGQQVPFPKPAGYDPDHYLLARRYLAALGESAVPRSFMGLGRLPNGKVDINSDGPVSTNLLGASWQYPEAGADRRAEIAAEHLSWAQGLLFFLANDPDVPEPLRRDMRHLGLPADEFTATGHWPPQLYVRDARRMLGDHVLTQHDLLAHDRHVEDAVGMGGYNIDVREVQWVAAPISRFPDVHDEVLTEGYLSVPVGPYPLPYRVLVPRHDECSNLLVSTCISASHIAFASFRMESGFMIAGHAAGVAAALAVETDSPFHDVDIGRLQALLRAQGQIFELPR